MPAWPASRVHGRRHGCMDGITGTWPASRVHGRRHGCMAGITGTWPAPRVHGRHHEYMAIVMRAWPASRGHGRHHRCIRMQGYMVEMARLHPGPRATGPRAGIGGGGDGAGASNPRLKPGVRAHVTGGGPCVTGTMACVTGAGPGSWDTAGVMGHGRGHGCMAGITGAWPASRVHGQRHACMAGITGAGPASRGYGRHHVRRAGVMWSEPGAVSRVLSPLLHHQLPGKHRSVAGKMNKVNTLSQAGKVDGFGGLFHLP